MLRAENADRRLSPIAIDLGLLSESHEATFNLKMSLMDKTRTFLENFALPSNKWYA